MACMVESLWTPSQHGGQRGSHEPVLKQRAFAIPPANKTKLSHLNPSNYQFTEFTEAFLRGIMMFPSILLLFLKINRLPLKYTLSSLLLQTDELILMGKQLRKITLESS